MDRFFILHLIRKVQYLMVPMAYYVIKINMVEHDQWTHDKEEGKRLCEGYGAHIAEMTLIFQLVYGALILMTWVVMWWMVDREDDQVEKEK